MAQHARSNLAMYLIELQSHGRITFTLEEAVRTLGLTGAAFLKSAGRLQKRRMLLSPRRGFYVVVPPQFNDWGAPPPSWYIDALMYPRPYYVGLLKAAALHGATHQAVMEFQVVTGQQWRKVLAGRSLLTFHVRTDMESVRDGIIDYKTPAGTMKVSSPELTAFDLFRYSPVIGGLHVIAQCLSDLGGKVDAPKMVALAPCFERTHVQRLGWMLDHLGYKGPVRALRRYLAATGQWSWVGLEPVRRDGRNAGSTLVERNRRWRVLVERYPEVDA